MLTAPGQRSDLTSTQHASKLDALEAAGVSRDQATRWERLADIPDDAFEAALATEERATTNGLIAAHATTRPGSRRSIAGNRQPP
jgi:hypothetical protein